MKKFISLTDALTNKPILIRTDLIGICYADTCTFKKEEKEITTIIMLEGLPVEHVLESIYAVQLSLNS